MIVGDEVRRPDGDGNFPSREAVTIDPRDAFAPHVALPGDPRPVSGDRARSRWTRVGPGRMTILGAVLAGGQSRRFGGDKAAAVLAGATLLDRAISSLSAHVATVVVCGREVAGTACLADRPRHGLGPLGGLNAALHHAATQGLDGVLTTGCDMPIFPDELATALIGPGPAALRGQHLAGYWPAELAAALDRHLATAEDRSLFAWFRIARPREVALPGIAIPNINTRDDLAALAGRWPGER